jgi:hypothetical protein
VLNLLENLFDFPLDAVGHVLPPSARYSSLYCRQR